MSSVVLESATNGAQLLGTQSTLTIKDVHIASVQHKLNWKASILLTIGHRHSYWYIQTSNSQDIANSEHSPSNPQFNPLRQRQLLMVQTLRSKYIIWEVYQN